MKLKKYIMQKLKTIAVFIKERVLPKNYFVIPPSTLLKLYHAVLFRKRFFRIFSRVVSRPMGEGAKNIFRSRKWIFIVSRTTEQPTTQNHTTRPHVPKFYKNIGFFSCPFCGEETLAAKQTGIW